MLNLKIEFFLAKALKVEEGFRISNDTSSKMTNNQFLKIKLTIAYDTQGVIKNPTHFIACPDLT
jgi:hypothetical protein